MKNIGVVESSEKNIVCFITEERIARGSFVFYNDSELNRKILCRIKESETIEKIPTEFLTASFESREAAKRVGFDLEDIGKFRVHAKIVGYFDEELNEFINPKVSPISGTPVFEADSSILSQINKKKDGYDNSATIGKIINSDTKVVLDVSDIVSTHLSVLASTGSGKSYTIGVLLEEMLKAKNGASAVVLDPHGEYRTLADIMDKQKLNETGVLEDFTYSDGTLPRVEVFDDEDIKVKVNDLTFNELVSIIDDGNMSSKMRYYLRKTYNNVRGKEFTKEELLDEVMGLENEEGEKLIKSPQHSSSIEGIKWRYSKNILNKKFFQNYTKLNLDELYQPRKISVLDLSDIGELDQQLIASVLLRKTFKARKKTVKNQVKSNEQGLPYPVFTVIEEGHRFTPASGEAKSKNILKKVLSEGRKFGVGVCLVSQRPSKLDSDALSQCMTQITMRLINPVDQNHVKESLESFSKELVDMLPGLSTGEALISGSAINTAVSANIREKITRHGGAGIDDPSSLWKADLEDEEPDIEKTEVEEDNQTDLFS
ncbi:ATPase [archaeon SCG-AAA382B04]|nr:ATPase [archaeon SCG-AAA382B04]